MTLRVPRKGKGKNKLSSTTQIVLETGGQIIVSSIGFGTII